MARPGSRWERPRVRVPTEAEKGRSILAGLDEVRMTPARNVPWMSRLIGCVVLVVILGFALTTLVFGVLVMLALAKYIGVV